MPAELFAAEKMSATSAIARVLEEAGIHNVFGVPGGHTGHIFAALEKHQNSIRTLLVRQETLAGVMAEVTGRLTGVPGVIMGQGSWVLGQGVVGTLEALLSSSPMLLLTELSDTPGFDLHAPYQAGTGDYGLWDARQAFKGICKEVFQARDPVSAVHATQLAIKHALSGQQGPVAVLYSRNALLGEIEPDCLPRLYKTKYYLPPAPPPAREDLVAEAAAAIRAAKRPIIVAGNGVRISRAEAALASFAEQTGIPVVTTASGKGVIDETHAMALGPFGTWGIGAGTFGAAEADLVIIAGSKVGASDIQRENPKLLDGARQTFVQIEIEPRNASWVIPAEHVLIGDCGAVLAQLGKAIAPTKAMAKQGRARVAELRTRHGYFDDPKREDDSAPIWPQRAIAAMQRILPKDAIVTCDAGANRMWVNHHYCTRAPGGALEPAGAGGMGYAIPAALAAKNAFPERAVVAVCGDGGFAMSMNGLISSIELGLRIIVVVFNNAQLGAVVHDTGAFGALFQDFDHAAMARGIGCLGIRVDAAADLEDAFREALASDRSAVIDVRITAEASFRHAMPPSLE